MPLPWFVQQGARSYVQKAYERLLRGFGPRCASLGAGLTIR